MAKKTSVAKTASKRKTQSDLDLYKVVSRTKSVATDMYEAYAFGKDPQDAFERVMLRLNRTKEAGVTKGQSFDIRKVDISNELVFGIVKCGDLESEE